MHKNKEKKYEGKFKLIKINKRMKVWIWNFQKPKKQKNHRLNNK